MEPRPELAEMLAHVAQEISAHDDLESTLDAIVEAAARSLRGIDHVGITLAHRDGQIETRAGTDELVWKLDAIQYELGEGPCIYALDVEPLVVLNDLHSDHRWPRYIPRALELGVKAQLGIRLPIDEQTLGGFNVYSTRAETIDQEIQRTAELFAVHAALALRRARSVESLTAGLSSRKVIGQAIGLVMERYTLDEDRAFEYLARISQRSNVKLRDVAQEVVAQANERGRGQGA